MDQPSSHRTGGSHVTRHTGGGHEARDTGGGHVTRHVPREAAKQGLRAGWEVPCLRCPEPLGPPWVSVSRGCCLQ